MTNDEIKNKISCILTKQNGSNGKIADAVCVCTRTVQRWRNGRYKKCDIFTLNDFAASLGYVMVIEFYEKH